MARQMTPKEEVANIGKLTISDISESRHQASQVQACYHITLNPFFQMNTEILFVIGDGEAHQPSALFFLSLHV